VVLVQPPIEDFYETRVRALPLGLCYLKAAVKREIPEVEVRVFDLRTGFGKRTIAPPPELSYLKDYYPFADSSPFSTFHNYYRFGAEPERGATLIAELRPGLIGISSLFSPYYREVKALAKAIKARWDAPIVVGGGHASACPRSLLSDPSIDMVIRGEGERPLVELIRALLAGSSLESLPNLAFRDNADIRLNPKAEPYPFEGLPWPDLSDLSKDDYLYDGEPMCMITSTRGCPHRCSFCSAHTVFEGGFRIRRPEDVFEEMQERFRQGYRIFDFEDDNLAHSKRDFLRLLQLIERGFPKRCIRLLAMNGISYASLDGEILAAMAGAGFEFLNLSLVSGSESTLSRLRRPAGLARFTDTVEAARAMGFRITAYQIIGLPGEGLEDMKETTALLARLPVLLGPSVYYSAPGSRLAGDLEELSDTDLVKARSTAMAFEGDGFTRREIYSLFVTTRIVNFLKSAKGLEEAREISLEDALDIISKQGDRARSGIEILRRLQSEKILYASTKKGLMPLSMFCFEVLKDVLDEAGWISTPAGGIVRIGGFL
jgi:radical SAM superfamily enzyme YgiQ (UPF0313 family)